MYNYKKQAMGVKSDFLINCELLYIYQLESSLALWNSTVGTEVNGGKYFGTSVKITIRSCCALQQKVTS